MPAKTAPAKLVREFTVSKDTPNAKQFKEVQDDPSVRADIGTIYLTKKALMPMGNTARIRVTVEAVGD